MKDIIYMDHAATTRVKPEVAKEMMPLFTDIYGNASGIYSVGREAKDRLETARADIAHCLNAKPEEIYFTGCGSEADNWAIRGMAYAKKSKGNHIITTEFEHHAVLHTCKQLEKEGFEVTYIKPSANGIVSAEDIEKAVKDTTILITVMFANNEIGTIQPIGEIAETAKKHKITFHTDAVQAVGAIPVDVQKLNVDLLSMSAHKFCGPKGVGALYIRKGVLPQNFLLGGAQERNRRAGTENIAGIVGMATALKLACANMDEHIEKMKTLRDYLINGVLEKIPHTRLNGDREKRLPANANFSFEFIEGEALLLHLDLAGICASSGSACTSGSLDPSHVLLSIGLPHEIAHGSLRLTLGDDNTKEQIDYVINELVRIVGLLRDMSPLYKK